MCVITSTLTAWGGCERAFGGMRTIAFREDGIETVRPFQSSQCRTSSGLAIGRLHPVMGARFRDQLDLTSMGKRLTRNEHFKQACCFLNR